MAGIPLFAGFVSKFYLAGAALYGDHSVWITMPVLAISTFLNGLYYFPVIIRIYSRAEPGESPTPETLQALENYRKPALAASVTLICLIAANVALGMFFAPLLEALETGFLWLG